MKQAFARLVLAVMVVLASCLAFGGTAAHARSSIGCKDNSDKGCTFTWHVGDEFLSVNAGHPGPPQAKAANGDVVTLKGTGAFGLHSKAASGGGMFRHTFADTGKTETGTFQARRVLSFESYGNGTPQGTPPNLFGGLLRLAVELTPDSEPSKRVRAVLTIDCLLGSPPEGAVEGIKLKVPGVINFNKTIENSGETVFVKL